MAEFTWRDLVACYARGVFPMAESQDDPRIFLVDPPRRGVLPLDERFHIPRRLARTVRSERFQVCVDADFAGVVGACAVAAARTDTWINAPIRRLYGELHAVGLAHSVECRRDGVLVGGLYGVALGGAFFGESMFSAARDASKTALVHLAARLRNGGYTLLDAQFLTEHLAQFGAEELGRTEYRRRLAVALERQGDFHAFPSSATGVEALTAIGRAR